MIGDLPRRIKSNICSFTGRAWLLPRLLNWLEGTDERLFLLTGEPGSGKSMVAAWLAGHGPAPADPEARARLEQFRTRVKAAHFCAAASRSTSPKACAENLANQLTSRVKGFSDALAESLAERVQIVGEARAGEVKAGAEVSLTGVHIDHLDLGTFGDEASFDRALCEPLEKLYGGGCDELMVLIVDSLDEAATYKSDTDLVRLLAKLDDLPEPVRFLATTRPDQRVLKYYRGAKRFDLILDGPVSDDDVRLYIRDRLSALEKDRRDSLAKRVTEAAEGNFLYAHLVLTDLLHHLLEVTDTAPLVLPAGLGGLYRDFLNREVGPDEDEWEERFKPVLGPIAVAQGEGLTAPQLEAITGREVGPALRACSQYLDGELPRGPFRPFHRSFTEFLLEDQENIDYHIDQIKEHRRIVEYYWANFKDDWGRCDDYGLRNLVAHLYALRGDPAFRRMLHDVAESEQFAYSRITRWHDPNPLLADIRLALGLALDDIDLAQVWRYIEHYRRIMSDERSSLRVIEEARRGEYALALERTALLASLPNSQALLRLWIAWKAAIAGDEDAAKTVTRRALEALPPRGLIKHRAADLDSTAQYSMQDAVGEALQRLLVRLVRSLGLPTLDAQRNWLAQAAEAWPVEEVEAVAGRLAEPLETWAMDLEQQYPPESIDVILAQLGSQLGQVDGAPNFREISYAHHRRAAAAVVRSRSEPHWQSNVQQVVDLIAMDDYPSYREMALAWLAAAVLTQVDERVAEGALAIVLNGILKIRDPGFRGDAVAAAIGGLALERNDILNDTALLRFLEDQPADSTVQQPTPSPERLAAGLPLDPWTHDMLRRNAVAAVLHRLGNAIKAEGVLEALSVAPHEDSYAGYRVLARLALACRWLEWHRADHAKEQLSAARRDADHMLDPLLAAERRDLIDALDGWLTEQGADEEASEPRRVPVGMMQSLRLHYLSAQQYPNVDALKALVVPALDDANAVDAVLGRVFGAVAQQRPSGQLFAKLINAMKIKAAIHNITGEPLS